MLTVEKGSTKVPIDPSLLKAGVLDPNVVPDLVCSSGDESDSDSLDVSHVCTTFFLISE